MSALAPSSCGIDAIVFEGWLGTACEQSVTEIAANTSTTLPSSPAASPSSSTGKRVFLIGGCAVAGALVLLVIALVISRACYYPTLRKLLHSKVGGGSGERYKVLDTTATENRL